MIDLALLRIIKYRNQYKKVARYIPKSAIDKRTRAVAADIGKYFAMAEEEEQLDFPSFRSMFFNTWHKGMKDEDCTYYNKLITRMETDVSESVSKNIINQLLELEFATDVANVVADYDVGGEIDIIQSVSNLVTAVQSAVEKSTSFEFASVEDSTIDESTDDSGMKWPLDEMNQIYRNILGGDLYIVAARPGKGKTSFLTHLNQCMAEQMDDDATIVWFNNESRRQRIMSRQIQSMLGMTNTELSALKKEKRLTEEYVKVAGHRDKVRVYDVHGKNNIHLEEILESVGKVGAIIIDMLDNVKYPTRTDVREDQRLEQLYQWARETGVKYNCPVFPTSQVSNEGSGLLFPTENMLKDSKTGKQGACDGIIMIGASDDPLQQNIRGISMPKTKSKREGQADMRAEILFDADRGRYLNGGSKA